jgi:hypothetical protein
MQKISDNGEACEYHRLGIPSDDISFGSNLSRVSMKSQMQKNGIKFLKRSNSIKLATEQYLVSQNAQFELRSCAELLVRQRHERVKHPHWDTFAGLAYQCKEPDCKCAHIIWHDMGRFMNHLDDFHGVEHPDLNHSKKVQQKLDNATVILSSIR